MPYNVVPNSPDCPTDTPWGVVKDATGETMGCHASESEAEDQAAALYASEGDGPPKSAPWRGPLAAEGITTGDGREFAPGALTWPAQIAPGEVTLRWNKEDSHGGDAHTVAVNVGRIDKMWRDGNLIMGEGVFNLATDDGLAAYERVRDGFLRGVSIDADNISDADVEFIWPENNNSGADNEDPPTTMFAQPEKVIFNAGRIRAATLVDIPAFTEAYIELTDTDSVTASATEAFGAVGVHHTDTSEGSWDAGLNEKRLPSPMALSVAQDTYAWIDNSMVKDGELPKTAGRFIHHEVSADGIPGAANLAACSATIAVLHGGRGGTTIPTTDMRGVYNHVAAHLRDAGRTPVPFNSDESLIASVGVEGEWTPPEAWFADPRLSVPTPITVDASGRVYGHAAQWGACHVGYTDQCVSPPKEMSHDYFMTGERLTAEGTSVGVGQITLATGHASLSQDARSAAEHYDHTGAAVADVVVGNDAHGIWVAGAIRPSADADRVHELRSSGQVSGDWRRIGGKLRLVGLLAVNVPGFPVPRMQARIASGALHALVAAGAPTVSRPRTLEMTQQEALQVVMDMVREQIMSGGE